jgi:beta-1,4-mannosyl-glycoprotein beta-1,4-N-acetylglucosaminyltransferase
MPKVFDCFPFFNELDLLEIRLNELDGIVDRFVLCESPYTFRGKPKPLHFLENRDRFARFLPRIEHVIVDDLPLGGPEIERAFFKKERFQRNALMRGLTTATPDDFVLLCDVDEIPRASAIEGIVRDNGPRAVHVLEMRKYRYLLNLRSAGPWYKARLARFGDIRKLQMLRVGGPSWAPKQASLGPVLRQWRRMLFGVRPRPWIRVPDAGWHFTSMNGAKAVSEKMQAYSHVHERFEEEAAVAEHIAEALRKAADPASHFSIEPFDNLPHFLAANQDRFASMLAKLPVLTASEAVTVD